MTTRTSTGTNRSTIIWIVVGVVVVVGLFALAIASAGGGGGGGLGGEFEVEAFGEVEVEGSLPLLDPNSFGVAVDDPATGMDAPRVSGTDWNGDPAGITDDGNPKVVVFLAHWCPHCQSEVPRLVSALDGGTTINGAEVIGIATSSNITRGNYPPAAWLANSGWTATTVMDDEDMSVLRAYGIGSFPGWAVIGADGTIIARATGELNAAQVEALAELAVSG